MDSKGQKAGKGPLIAEEISNTLGTSQDQYLFQPVGVDCYNLALTGDKGRCLATASGGLNEHIPVVLQPAAYGVVTKGNGDAFISKEKHTSLSTGGGQAGQGYPCVLLDDQGGSVMRVSNGDVSPTLRAQMNGHPPVIVNPIAFDGYNQSVTGDVTTTLRAGMSNCSADTVPVVLENHPSDSRVRIDESGIVQTLTSSMGTGGGNVPLVMMPFLKSRRAKSAEDFETWKESRVSNTINTFDQGDVRATDVVVCIQGNVIDRSDNAGANGAGWRTDKCYTLNTIDRPAVVYALDQQGGKGGANYSEDIMPTLCSDSHGTPHAVVYALAVESHPQDSRVKISEDNVNQPLSANMEHDASNGGLVLTLETFHCTIEEDKTAPLKARDYKDPLVIAMDRAAFNQGENAKYDFQIDGGVQRRRSSHAVPVQSVINNKSKKER